MSTGTLPEPIAATPAPTTRPKPKPKKRLQRDHVKHYRKIILRGEIPTSQECLDAGCFVGDPLTDRATLIARQNAATELRDLPSKIEAARRVKRITLEDFGSRPIPATIGELSAALWKYETRVARPFEALPEDLAAAEIARDDRSRFDSASDVLFKTAAPDLLDEIDVLERKKTGFGLAIRSSTRQPKLKPLLAEISGAEAERDAIFQRGRVAGDDELLVKLESKIAELKGGTRIAEDNERADEEARTQIDALQTRIDEARVALHDPEQMRFAVDRKPGANR
jgi:hypothetical protein